MRAEMQHGRPNTSGRTQREEQQQHAVCGGGELTDGKLTSASPPPRLITLTQIVNVHREQRGGGEYANISMSIRHTHT